MTATMAARLTDTCADLSDEIACARALHQSERPRFTTRDIAFGLTAAIELARQDQDRIARQQEIAAERRRNRSIRRAA